MSLEVQAKRIVGDLLGDGPPPLRLVLRHVRRSSFRWVGLIELSLALGVLSCLIPVIAAALLAAPFLMLAGVGVVAAKATAILGALAGLAGAANGPHRLLRRAGLRRWHHDLELIRVGEGGETLATKRVQSQRSALGEAIVGALLSEAQAKSCVVVELIGAECAELWYGGQPLLATPGLSSLEASRLALEAGGSRIEEDERSVRVSRPQAKGSRALALSSLALAPVSICARLLQRVPWREPLVGAWLDLRGAPAGDWVVELIGEGEECGVECRLERDGAVLWRDRVPAAELLAYSWSPALSWDSEVRRLDAELRVVGSGHTLELPAAAVGPRGSALRAFLMASTLRLGARWPDSGLPAGTPGPTHCPYCGAWFELPEGPEAQESGCPACGAWPEALRA